MSLTKKKEEQLRKMPAIETKITKSDDGKWLIHRTSITHVRPVAYYQAVLDNDGEAAKEAESNDQVSLEDIEAMKETPVA